MLKHKNCFLFSSLSFILLFLRESDCVYTCTTIDKNEAKLIVNVNM